MKRAQRACEVVSGTATVLLWLLWMTGLNAYNDQMGKLTISAAFIAVLALLAAGGLMLARWLRGESDAPRPTGDFHGE